MSGKVCYSGWDLEDVGCYPGAAVGRALGSLNILLKLLNFDFQILRKSFLPVCTE